MAEVIKVTLKSAKKLHKIVNEDTAAIQHLLTGSSWSLCATECFHKVAQGQEKENKN